MANILSLFDGMSCGMLAMMGAGVDVENYYAYEIDKYAIQTATHNFPQIQELGDVFNANFIQYKGVDYLIGGSPCVPANTKIKTDKGYKRIDNIKIGDMVLTHKNRYRPVSRLYKRQTDHLYHIKFNGNQTLNITGNHPIYVYRNNKFEFIRTDELTTDDFVCININGGKNKLPYSDDILWLVGRAIADGYLSNDKNIIVISVGKKKIDEFENHLLEIPYYITHKDRAAPEYYIKSKELTELYSYFGNNIAINKYIPDEILNLSKEQLLKIWEGYISGDGFVRKDRPNTVMWCSSSEDLILSMGLLTAKLFGKYPTTTIRLGEYKKMPSGMCYTNDSYNSQISITDRVNPDCMIITDKLLIRIKNIEKENITTDVYNIETAQDHSYTVNNCIVHNCTYWSIAQSPDKRETTASGIGWELFSQYVRALHEAKPKFFIYENNKSMAKAIRESITQTFGFEPICINSALVSAQNRQRLYWVGKRNTDGTYSKVDIEQPEDRGILLKDILDGADLTNCDKAYCLTSSYDGACAWNTIERHQRSMVAEPVGTAKDGKAYCLSAGYSNGSGEKIGNYAAHTLTKGCKSMVAEPVNVTADGKAQCLRATCYKDGVRNIAGNDIDKKTGVAEPVCIASRGRYSDTDSRSSKTDAPTYQHYEARTDGKTNAVTTVSKDNLIGEPVCMRYERSESAKQLRKDYESGAIKHGYHEYHELQPRADGKSNTLSTVQKDNPICVPVRCFTLPREDGAQTIKAQYSNTDVNNICKYSSNYGASGVTEPVAINTFNNEGRKSRTVMSGYYKYGEATILTNKGFKGGTTAVAEPVDKSIKVGIYPTSDCRMLNSQGMRIYSVNGESVTQSAQGGGKGTKTGLYAIPIEFSDLIIRKNAHVAVNDNAIRGVQDKNNASCAENFYEFTDTKANTLTTAHRPKIIDELSNYTYLAEACEWNDNGEPTKAISFADGKKYTVYTVKDGQITIKEKQYPIKLQDGYYIIRKLTVSECKRLQTVPEWFEFPVSDTQAYKMLGNGWTVDIITHLIKATLQSQ